MRNTFILSILISVISVTSYAEPQDSDLQVVCKVADNLVKTNSCALVENTPGVYKINNRLAEWRYANGICYQAMLQLWKSTQNIIYKDYVLNQFNFFFKNKKTFEQQYIKGIRDNGYDGFIHTNCLDHCGAMTAALISVYSIEKNVQYMDYINHTADYILHRQFVLPNGMFCRGIKGHETVWLDDLYMSVSFLASMGVFSKDQTYFDCATKQVIEFNNLLYDSNKHIYRHCYYCDLKEQGVACWGRANGWNLMAQAWLLNAIPKGYVGRDSLLKIFRTAVSGICEYQSASGLWHQLLDKNDSYLEVSCSAMFAYVIAKGVNEGWIDKGYASVARLAWEGIKSNISSNGDIYNICIGTGISHDLPFYYNRPTLMNDIHGYGPVIMAGVEVYKMNNHI